MLIRHWIIIGEVDPKNMMSDLGSHGKGPILPSALTHEPGFRFDWNIGGDRYLRMMLVETMV